MTISYQQAKQAAREKADQADFGSPFRYLITARVPAVIRQYCPSPARVLDLGCGSGRYALFFIEADVAGTYTGVDISDERWTKMALPDEFTGRLVKLDAHHVDKLADRFDFVISLTAFEHFADDQQVMRAMAAVMKPGAHALLVVPSTWSYPLYGRHGYRRYCPARISRLAEATGLETIVFEKIGGLTGWLFHFAWFAPAHLARLAIKAVIYGLYGMNKPKAKKTWPRLFAWLNGLGNHHLKWSWGRRLHRLGLKISAKIDRCLPLLPVGYLAVLTKRP